MNWPSLSTFIAMGGYGPYVWGAFGVTALVMTGELLSLRARRRALQVDDAAPQIGTPGIRVETFEGPA